MSINRLQRTYEKKNDGGEPTFGEMAPVEELDDEKADDKRRILCAVCEHLLTTSDARTLVEGAHRHVKVNPHGHIFHFACFAPTSGVAAIGAPSSEWSWFSGFRWQIGLCAGCGVHLGWVFSDDAQFTALIEDRFVEAGD